MKIESISKKVASTTDATSRASRRSGLPATDFSCKVPADEPKIAPRLFGPANRLPERAHLPSRKSSDILSTSLMGEPTENPGQKLSAWIGSFTGSDQQIIVDAIRHYQQTIHPDLEPAPPGEIALTDETADLILKICDAFRHDPLEAAHQLALAETQYNPMSPEAQERRLRSSLHLDSRQQPLKKDSGSSSSEGGSNPVDSMVPGMKSSGASPAGPSQNQR